MGVQRRHFEAVEGFDESLPTLFETDFCWKMQLRGIPLTPLHDAVVHVRRRARVGDLLQQARKYAECDVLLYKRYRPLGMPKLSKKTGLKAWMDLIVGVPALARDETRARYLWDLGWRAGRLHASTYAAVCGRCEPYTGTLRHRPYIVIPIQRPSLPV